MTRPLALVLMLAAAPATAAEETSATRELAKLRVLFERVECKELMEAAPYVEEHRLATLDERLEAMFMHAYCHVLAGNNGAAAAKMNAIVKEDIEAQPPFEVEPRVRVMLEMARTQERARLQKLAAEELARILARLKLDVDEPAPISGGNRADLVARLVDPDGLVRSMRVAFRRRGDPEFYALPIARQGGDGASWRGTIPGEFTKTRAGTVLEWFVTASDEKGGTLVSVGTREQPRVLEVKPGSVVALDVPANQRYPHEWRIAGAASAGFLLPLGGMVLGYGAAGALLALPNQLRTAEPDQSAEDQAAQALQAQQLTANLVPLVIASLIALPPIFGTLGAVAVAVTALDGTNAWWPPAVALVGGIVYSTLLAFAINSADTYKPLFASTDETPWQDGNDDFARLALASLFVAAAASAATTTTLVILDPPPE